MSLSVITPTEERPTFLLSLYQVLLRQESGDWEWLIYDSSLRPCKELLQYNDPRIHYIHDLDRKTIGERRNLLVQKAKGEIIVHFDDDDYYAPHYLSTIKEALKKDDFFHIHSWFAYHAASRQFFYWDSQEKTKSRMALNPLVGARVREIDFGQEAAENMIKHGYGFTFAYRKYLAEKYPFPAVDLGEDENFFNRIPKEKVVSIADREGLALKVIHDTNVSCIFPQFMIPRFMIKTAFPHLAAHEDRYLSRG
ncbi:MAG: glycosyltransferase family 2 protein [Chlamydiales bacterium]|nr:glycosyltransferase family 2 protein [Chlamydiales bacterium]